MNSIVLIPTIDVFYISFADIIKLKGYDNYESFANGSNIIWDYNKDANT